MLWKAEAIRGCTVNAQDEEIGKVRDLYFDDHTWTVRYLVVDVGTWFDEKPVLITPRRITRFDPEQEFIGTDLTREDVKNSPPAETDRPLSQCMDIVSYPYHFWPPEYDLEGCDTQTDVHLRSMNETEGYIVAASDGELGHAAGFFMDAADWTVRYVEVDTRNLWPGKHVLMSTEWMEEIDWSGARLVVNLDKETIKDSPEFDRHTPLTRQYETHLCHFYNREGYWTHEPCADDDETGGESVD